MEPDVSETESQNILREVRETEKRPQLFSHIFVVRAIQAKTLYDTYFSPTAWDKIRMDDSVVNDLKLGSIVNWNFFYSYNSVA